MDKMRWFIIGNLIGFGVLICGIGINESLKHRAAVQGTDQPADTEKQTETQTGIQTGKQSSNPIDKASNIITSNSSPANSGTSGSSALSSSTPSSSIPSLSIPSLGTPKRAVPKSAVNGVAMSNTSNASEDNSIDVANDNVSTVGRVVTTRDISKGTILHAGDVEIRQVDVKKACKDGLTKFDEALGMTTRIDLVEGEMVQLTDVEAK